MTDETPYEAAIRLCPGLPWERHQDWTRCKIGQLQMELICRRQWKFAVFRCDPLRIEWESQWCDTPEKAVQPERVWLAELGEALLALAEVKP